MTDDRAPEIDFGRDTTDVLVQVRTVLSRAETALKMLRGRDGTGPVYWVVPPQPIFSGTETNDYGGPQFLGYSDGISVPHPGGDEMVSALEGLIERLSPFRRTGRPKK
ncbi:hypothetical protein [Amycolatopsis anabasis]|uniref:hypothetical protein n=1 Tax=Amycolatopsis anabasis TaxID=1840409 RepID=UPI00131E73ED|nr:hypothetical protein [Amycolatopsis anabasis]